MKLTIDDVVICLALVLGFSVSLMLSIANQVWGARFPPSLIAFFAAISVAALNYRFLGGSGDAQFRMGVLRVTGSAAIVFGAMWFLGNRIEDQTLLYTTDAQYRPAIESNRAENTRLARANAVLTKEVNDLKDRLTELGSGKTKYSIDEIKRMPPDHEFVSAIRRLIANEDPPFRQTLKEISALVTINDSMVTPNVYRICPDTQERLFAGLETRKDRLRMRRAYGDGETGSVDMDRGGLILPDADVCPVGGRRTFDIQITCADAAKLFPDRIARCSGLKPIFAPGVSTIRGSKVSLGALPPN